MATLLDSNVAVRCVLASDPSYQLIRDFVNVLIYNEEQLFVCAQVLAEAWSFLTRPSASRGGYGLLPRDADSRIEAICHIAQILPEPAAIWHTHRSMLREHSVSGVQVHDCRLVALCHLSGVEKIVTLNDRDFGRYETTAINPLKTSKPETGSE